MSEDKSNAVKFHHFSMYFVAVFCYGCGDRSWYLNQTMKKKKRTVQRSTYLQQNILISKAFTIFLYISIVYIIQRKIPLTLRCLLVCCVEPPQPLYPQQTLEKPHFLAVRMHQTIRAYGYEISTPVVIECVCVSVEFRHTNQSAVVSAWR